MTNRSNEDHCELKKSGDRFADQPLKDKIGSSLKQLYDDVVNEAVPDDFLALLEKADKTKD
jgi:hypothetical protein